MDDYYSYKRGLDDGRNEMLKVIEDIKAEIEALDIEDVCAKEHGCHKEVLEIIDRKVNEVADETSCR